MYFTVTKHLEAIMKQHGSKSRQTQSV